MSSFPTLVEETPTRTSRVRADTNRLRTGFAFGVPERHRRGPIPIARRSAKEARPSEKTPGIARQAPGAMRSLVPGGPGLDLEPHVEAYGRRESLPEPNLGAIAPIVVVYPMFRRGLVNGPAQEAVKAWGKG